MTHSFHQLQHPNSLSWVYLGIPRVCIYSVPIVASLAERGTHPLTPEEPLQAGGCLPGCLQGAGTALKLCRQQDLLMKSEHPQLHSVVRGLTAHRSLNPQNVTRLSHKPFRHEALFSPQGWSHAAWVEAVQERVLPSALDSKSSFKVRNLCSPEAPSPGESVVVNRLMGEKTIITRIIWVSALCQDTLERFFLRIGNVLSSNVVDCSQFQQKTEIIRNS